MPPVFFTLDEILKIHSNQITRYGGDPGIRDIDLLLTAIGMPAAGIRDRYLHRDLFEMAAAYLFHIVQDHPFVDGNKRTGIVAALIFLDLNGIEIELNQAKLESMVRSVAEGKMDTSKVADLLRRGAAS